MFTETGTTKHISSSVGAVDGDIALKAAEYWREFRSQGTTLGQADALIAAAAQVLKLVLVTYNSNHYPMKDTTLYQPMPELA